MDIQKDVKVFLCLLLSFFTAFIVVSSTALPVTAFSQNIRTTLHADYLVDYNTVDDISSVFDYSFSGEVTEYISTSQYNGNGTDIPYSFYQVNVIDVFKGNVGKSVIITFYGGVNEEGILVLFQDSVLPVIGEKYMFFSNMVTSSGKEDGRNIKGSYAICVSYSMVSLERFEKNKYPEEIVLFDSNFATSESFNDDFVINSVDPGGGGGYTNISFSTAALMSMDTSYSMYLSSSTPALYYKVTASTLNYLSIFSTGSLDTVVELYNSSYTLISTNNNVSGRGLSFTTGTNFFLNFYKDKNLTYYFKIRANVPGAAGSTTIEAFIDNWYSSSYSNLVWAFDFVDGANKIDYKNQTVYDSELALAITEWNKLDTISIQLDTIFTTNDVTISDYTDSTSGSPVAVTNWLFATIKFNNFYFSSMSATERQKTIMHELGHALGLNEFTGYETTINVMVQGIRSMTNIGPADIGIYRQKWD